MIQLAHGYLIDLAKGGFTEALRKLAISTYQRMELRSEFELANGPADSNSIRVTFDGRTVPFIFDSDQNEVSIFGLNDKGCSRRSWIDISYCLDLNPKPKPTPTHCPWPG